MADWRIRHFVPDSDGEEDDNISTQSTERADRVLNHGDEFVDLYKFGETEAVLPAAEDLLPPLLYEDSSEDELGEPATRSAQRSVPSSYVSLEKLFSDGRVSENSLTKAITKNPKPGSQSENESQGHAKQNADGSEYMSTLQADEGDGGSMLLSSSLSEPDSSPSLPHGFDLVEKSQTGGVRISQTHETANILSKMHASDATSSARRRSFRVRKPEQLKPYTIEDARHRKTFQAGGLKPIRYREASIEAVKHHRRNNPPDFDYEEQTQDGADKHKTWLSSSPRRVLPASSPPNYTDDLPNLDDLLQEHNTEAVRTRNKRRKVRHKYTPKQIWDVKEPLNASMKGTSNSDEGPHSNELSSVDFDVPISPPCSSPCETHKSMQAQIHNGFRFPPGITPPQSRAQLQSPERTSELRPVLTSSAQLIPEQYLEDGLHRDSATMDDSEQSRSESELASKDTNSNDELEFKKQSRRLKGVLPASYFRMTMKVQARDVSTTTKETERRRANSPIQSAQRGIARPVLNPRPALVRSKTHELVDLVSSEGESSQFERHFGEENIPRAGLPHHTTQRHVPVRLVATEDDELMEDNNFDRMEPTVRRRRGRHRNRKHRQARINQTSATFLEEPARQRVHQTKISGHVARFRSSKQEYKKRKAPPIGVADVIDSETIQAVPDFLRIAARTASSRKDQGRHSPSRKLIQLATREDTADVEAVLDRWKNNKIIRPVRSVAQTRRPHQPRPPLASISNNQRLSKLTQKKLSFTEILQQSHCDNVTAQQAITEILRQTNSRSGQSLSCKTKNLTAPKGHINQNLSFGASISSKGMPAVLEEPRRPSRRQSLDRANVADANKYVSPALERSMHDRSVGSSPTSFLLEKINDENELIREDLPSKRHRPKKRNPRQIQITSPFLQQNVHFGIITKDPEPVELDQGTCEEKELLVDFSSYGYEYTTDFDVKPLPFGTYFPQDTLLGNGKFSNWVHSTMSRNMSLFNGQTSFTHKSQQYEWDAWTESVSSDIGQLLNDFVFELRAGLDSESSTPRWLILDSIAEYFSTGLMFLDEVDRSLFVKRTVDALEELSSSLDNFPQVPTSVGGGPQYVMDEIRMRLMLLLWQMLAIAQDGVVLAEYRNRAQSLFEMNLRLMVRLMFTDGISDYNVFLRTVQDYANLDLIPLRCMKKVETFLICIHLVSRTTSSVTAFLDALNNTPPLHTASAVRSIRTLDRKWFSLFVLLPFFDITTEGVVDASSRQLTTLDNWSLVESLINPIIEAYKYTLNKKRSTINDYFRSILGRCLSLIRIWGWKKCEQILKKVYDFFSMNFLSDLPHEESRGSPQFLQCLGNDLDLAFSRGDKAFILFLKILSSGLLGMRDVYTDKKIQNLVWRFIPNNGRALPKDQSIPQEDLDALRNHHSLLTVLYFASPRGCRPRLDTLQNLVPIRDSHQEACQINIRTWSTLVAFQLSQDEPASALMPFLEWYGSFVSQTAEQHKLARSEVEEHSMVITKEERESHIALNQRPIEIILFDALDSLQRVTTLACTTDSKNALFTDSLCKVLGLFESSQTRVNKVVIRALEVIRTFLQPIAISQPSDDSQDYGEWPMFDEEDNLTISDQSKDVGLKLPEKIYDTVHVLLSNCFGAEHSPSDQLLNTVVDSWVGLSIFQVKASQRSWNNYIDPYGQESWSALRNTEQTLLYTPLFFAKLIGLSPEVYDEHRAAVLRSWIISLAVRESRLKFQHLFTVALINRDPSEPLFENLPLVRDSSGTIELSQEDFAARRLSLISCILSNMRASLECVGRQDSPAYREKRQEYTELLRALMNSMKQTYESLGNGPDIQSAYVEFVQSVVSFLQQHTADICPIDKFFTDARTFPLPANDPTYVVGRLRNYGLKLHDSKTTKRLVTFIQSVTERALIDGQEKYLVGQLQAAMSDAYEAGDQSKPSLRSYLIQAILPAYTEAALKHECGWLLATPFLQSLQGTMSSVLLDLDGGDSESVCAVTATVTALLSSIQGSVADLVHHPERFDLPQVVRVLTVYYALVTAALRPLDYCMRLQLDSKSPHRLVSYLRSFSDFALGSMNGTYESDAPADPDLQFDPKPMSTRGVGAYAANELTSTLVKSWHRDADRFCFKGNGGMKDISVDLLDFEGERARFELQHRLFTVELASCPSFTSGQRMLISRDTTYGEIYL